MADKPLITPAQIGKSGLVNMGVMAASAVALKGMGASNDEIANMIVPGREAMKNNDTCGVIGEYVGVAAGIGGGIAGAAVTGPAAVVAVPVAATAAAAVATPAATYTCNKIKNFFGL